MRCKECGFSVCENCDIEKENGTLLHIAAYFGSSAAIITGLVAVGGQELLDARDGSGKTARQHASDRGHGAFVEEIDRWAAEEAPRGELCLDADADKEALVAQVKAAGAKLGLRRCRSRMASTSMTQTNWLWGCRLMQVSASTHSSIMRRERRVS